MLLLLFPTYLGRRDESSWLFRVMSCIFLSCVRGKSSWDVPFLFRKKKPMKSGVCHKVTKVFKNDCFRDIVSSVQVLLWIKYSTIDRHFWIDSRYWKSIFAHGEGKNAGKYGKSPMFFPHLVFPSDWLESKGWEKKIRRLLHLKRRFWWRWRFLLVYFFCPEGREESMGSRGIGTEKQEILRALLFLLGWTGPDSKTISVYGKTG